MQCTLPLHRAALWGSARFPQATNLQCKLLLAVWTLSLDAVVSVLVDATVKILQVTQVCCVKAFDNFWIDHFQRTKLCDHSCEQNHDQVSGIALHSRILERRNLIECRCQTHDACLMQAAIFVDITDRQSERKLC